MPSALKSVPAQYCYGLFTTGLGVVIGDVIGYLLMAAGLIGLLYVLAKSTWPWTAAAPFGAGSKKPLRAAAARIYRRLPPGDYKNTIGDSDRLGGPTAFLASLLIRRSRDNNLPVYGRREPHLPLEQIPEHELFRLSYDKQQDCFVDQSSPTSTKPKWTDIRVTSKAIQKITEDYIS